MMMSLVSIVIPCYNHEKYVQECIQSVIDQDYENIELIIIDDGSKDDSVEKIRELVLACNERFVRFEFISRPNKGLCATLNEALELCEGDYFSVIASDDLMSFNRVKKLVDTCEKLNDQNVAGIFSGVTIIDDNGAVILSKKGRRGFSNFENVFKREHSFYAPSAFLKTKELISVGGYKEFGVVEDYYMWLKLTENGKVLYTIPDILVTYRRHAGNTSSRHNLIWESLILIYDQYKGKPDYNYALAKSMLVHAGDYLATDKWIAIRWLMYSVTKSKKVLLSRSFYVFFYRYLFH